MANHTQGELALAVLQELNQVDATESGDQEDHDYITGIYGAKYEELASKDLNYWPLDAIPGAIFLIIRDLIINEVSGTYGQVQTREDKAGRETVILKDLRQHMQKRSSGLPVRSTYF